MSRATVAGDGWMFALFVAAGENTAIWVIFLRPVRRENQMVSVSSA